MKIFLTFLGVIAFLRTEYLLHNCVFDLKESACSELGICVRDI